MPAPMAGVTAQADSDPALAPGTVVFTGKLASMTRRDAAAIVESAGGRVVTTVSRRTSTVVVGMEGWPLLPDGRVSRSLRRAEEMKERGDAIQIISEAVFLERLGLQERQPRVRKSYPAEQVCQLVGLDPAVLRRWEVMGLVRSHRGLYDFQDIVSLRTLAELIGRGVSPQTIGKSVRGLASVLPDTERPLAQLKLVEASGALLAELGDILVAPDGQLLMNFQTSDTPPPPSLALQIFPKC